MMPTLRTALAVLSLALAGPAAAQALSFNAATYNLRLNTPADGPNAWPLRKDAVKALLLRHQVDLLATQEALYDQVQDLATLPGFDWVGVGRDDGQHGGEHAALFFRRDRFERLDQGDFWLSETPDRPGKGWDARCCNRIASWVRLRDRPTGREFVAFSVHFDHEGVIARRESAHLMLRRMQQIAGPLPLLCLGDFNATPESEPIRIMAAALRDARQVSATPPVGPVGTFNDFKPDAPLLDRIDYVWLGPGWQVQRYAALADTTADGRYPSDHLPVLVRLHLP